MIVELTAAQLGALALDGEPAQVGDVTVRKGEVAQVLTEAHHASPEPPPAAPADSEQANARQPRPGRHDRDPYERNANYDGKCQGCGVPFERGDRIVHAGRGRQYCPPCGYAAFPALNPANR